MRISIMLTVIVSVMFPVTGQAIEVSGDQWGTWTRENNPYNVIGEIHVPGESTLVIEPGVIVKFQGHYNGCSSSRLQVDCDLTPLNQGDKRFSGSFFLVATRMPLQGKTSGRRTDAALSNCFTDGRG